MSYDIEILDFNKIELNNIRFTKIQTYGIHYHISPIKLKRKKIYKNIYVQTPRMYLPFPINESYNESYNKSTIDLSFMNRYIDEKVNLFYIFLQKIEDIINNVISIRKESQWKKMDIYNKKWIPFLRTTNANYPQVFRIKIDLSDDSNVIFYDENLNIMKCQSYTPPCYGVFILRLSYLWFNTNKYGCSWDVIQCKILDNPLITSKPPPRLPYLFINQKDKSINSASVEKANIIKSNGGNELGEAICDHPKYKKFFKMKKMGIPLPAIKQKITMSGLNPNIMDYPENTSITNIAELRKSDLKKDEENNSIKSIGIGSIINKDMLSLGLSGLKKATLLDKSKQKKQKKQKKNRHTNLMVPSLDEIQEAFKRLKKKSH